MLVRFFAHPVCMKPYPAVTLADDKIGVFIASGIGSLGVMS
jgi:hypothetical protein